MRYNMTNNVLPKYILESIILSENEKLKLAQLDHLPSEHEVDSIRNLPEFQELLNAFIGDESTRDTHLQLKAKEYLERDEVLLAWKILLL